MFRAFNWLSLGVLVVPLSCAEVKPVPMHSRSAHFEKVNQHLDPGGTIYLYLDTEGDLEQLGQDINHLLQQLPKNQSEEKPISLDASKLVERLGLNHILAAGLSSYREGQVFHNKAFLYHRGEREGLLRAMGGEPHAFEVTRLAPQNADWVFEHDVHLKSIYDVVASILVDIVGSKAETALQKLEEKIPGLSVSYKQLIDQLDTRLVGFLRLDESKSWTLPGVSMSFPSMDFLVGADHLGMVFDAVAEKTKGLPLVQPSEEGNLKMLEFALPLPQEMISFRPMLAKEINTGRLFLASNRSLLKEYLNNQAGLNTLDSFKQATMGFAAKGNGFSYCSPVLVSKFQNISEQISNRFPDAKISLDLLRLLLPIPNVPVAHMNINLPDGVLYLSNATSSHKSTLVTMLYANPMVLGIMTAVAVPAFIEYRRRAEDAAAHENPVQSSGAKSQGRSDLPQPRTGKSE